MVCSQSSKVYLAAGLRLFACHPCLQASLPQPVRTPQMSCCQACRPWPVAACPTSSSSRQGRAVCSIACISLHWAAIGVVVRGAACLMSSSNGKACIGQSTARTHTHVHPMHTHVTMMINVMIYRVQAVSLLRKLQTGCKQVAYEHMR